VVTCADRSGRDRTAPQSPSRGHRASGSDEQKPTTRRCGRDDHEPLIDSLK